MFIVKSNICNKIRFSTPKKAIIANKNLATRSHVSKKVLEPSSLKFASSHLSCPTVASALLAFNTGSNIASHDLLRPKRRHYYAPAHTKIHPPIKKCLTSYLTSPYSSKVSASAQRKEIPSKRHNLSPVPYRSSSILTSWDEDIITKLK